MLDWVAKLAPGKFHVNGADDGPWFSDAGFSRQNLARTGSATVLRCYAYFTGALERYRYDDVGNLHLLEYMVELAKAYATEPGRLVWVEEFGTSPEWMPEQYIPTYADALIRNAASCGHIWGFTWWCSHDIDPSAMASTVWNTRSVCSIRRTGSNRTADSPEPAKAQGGWSAVNLWNSMATEPGPPSFWKAAQPTRVSQIARNQKSREAKTVTFGPTHRACPQSSFVSSYGLEKVTKRNKTKRRTTSPMLNEERRRKILELVERDGRVMVKDLGRRFSTSLITIRKDLEHLHQKGLIQRAHGGALPVDAAALRDPTLHEKERLHRSEKLRIAEAAARLVRPGQVIILDSGTTTTAVARATRDISNLTVITNAVNIAAELAGTRVEVILTGGALRKNSFSLVGPLAEDSLRHVSADLLFLAVDGFDVRYGLTTPNQLEARVNRVMMESAKTTVVVCDSSKFGKRSLSLIAPTSAVHHAITDRNISSKDLRTLREAGVRVALT
jgi:DeoR family transcriptional regulator, aga operon transcriptional repressor